MAEKITANNIMELDESNRTQQDEQPRPDRKSGRAASRRQFLGLAASAASGLALSSLAPDLWAQNACTAHQGQPLAAIGEIRSNGTVLQGIVDLTVQERAVSYYNAPIFGCDTHHLRAYQGYRGFSLADPVFTKAQMAVEGPGPTFRIGVGETMEVIFLNRIDPAQFPKTSVTSVYGQCDTVVGAGGTGVAYPGADATNFPNCFHGSNTTNLHWHGTHTSPNAFADNVLLSVFPDAKLNVAAAIAQCKQAYAAWASGQDPTKTLVAAATANLNSMYQAAVASKNQNLVVQLKAAVQNDHSETGATPPEFPQF